MGPEGRQEGGASGADPRTPVLRISQLDAFELDSALEQLLWSQFSQCFQNLGPGLLTPLEAELKVLLQMLVWRFSVYPGSFTVGQALLGLRFHNALSHAPRYRSLTFRQRVGLLLLGAGPRWLRERSHSLLRSLGADPGQGGARSEGLRKGLGLLSGLVQTANLVNFLVFLRKGRHPSLSERILGVRAVFSRPPGARNVAFQYVNRELLWHGFAEFLIFLLPLVDMRRAKAALRYFLSGPAEEGEGAGAGGGQECGFCGEWPTMPHTIGCPHVFCYYCVKSHAIADGYLTCPQCGQEAAGAEPLQLQIEMTEIHAR
ncbi:peroxisome biogenesis factor 2 isoform X2 [Hypomesus transpacificus]|uniref:peroxisome biogenesis factor 2 isoform X2 n=1 Tax=Hypomesus transpacificus TaxID=137520 RepID=UPI001F0827EC|nr:peroxisome biogenesis factor 2 isoform X2 [Hypomesus transpacificus]